MIHTWQHSATHYTQKVPVVYIAKDLAGWDMQALVRLFRTLRCPSNFLVCPFKPLCSLRARSTS